MQVQIVRGSTRHKVLSEARRTLGPDPLILAVRRQPKEGSDDFEWEAVVARETPAAPQTGSASFTGPARGLAALRRELKAAQQQNGSIEKTELIDLARRLAQLESEVLAGLLEGRALPQSWVPLLDRLDASGYPKGDALRLIQAVEKRHEAPGDDLSHAYQSLRVALGAQVEVAPCEERVAPGLVVFCGGAGVGKTTLAAKLAADLCLGGSRRPVLGVLMPRRGVGVETLRRCARTLNIDFEEVGASESLVELATHAVEHPVILDCASVNPRDEKGLAELKSILRAAPTAEIHTVVPATFAPRDFDTALSAFGAIGAKRLSVTHLDEAPYVGRVLAAAGRASVAIGYVSQGPRIPDDLVRPSLDALLNAVLSTEVVASL